MSADGAGYVVAIVVVVAAALVVLVVVVVAVALVVAVVVFVAVVAVAFADVAARKTNHVKHHNQIKNKQKTVSVLHSCRLAEPPKSNCSPVQCLALKLIEFPVSLTHHLFAPMPAAQCPYARRPTALPVYECLRSTSYAFPCCSVSI